MRTNLYRLPSEETLTDAKLNEFIMRHSGECAFRYSMLQEAYETDYPILHEPLKPKWKPDNRIMVNFAKYIVDTMNGFFIGHPIKLQVDDGNEAVEKYVDFLDQYNDQDDNNAELSKICSIFGKRETEHAKKNKMSEQTYAEEIRKTYAYIADQIQKEIDGFYAKYANAEKISLAEAKRRVSKLDIEEYGRKAAKYVKEKDFSDQANEEMRLYNATMKINRLELLKANIGLEMVSGFDELQKYFDKTLTQQTIEEFRRQAGILGNSVQENGKMARAIVDASFHNATYSDRIWMYQDMLKAELDKLLKTGLIQGKNPRELAVHLQKRFGASREDAERLMVTELARVQTEAQKQSYIRNGFEEYTYVACGNADVCERCQALDGKHFKVQDMMPGTNAPPMHPRCHCSTAAYEDSAEYEKWLDFLEQGGTTEEWEASKNRKARYKDNEGIFQTLDGRSKGRDVIKPRNIMKEMKKSSIGTEMLEYLQENDIQIKVWYGVDVDEGLDGLFEDGEINIYADNTKTVRETAITVIHEATHAKINKPNTKSQELQCYVNEYRHQNIELTEKVLQDIINHINDKYPNLKWE